MTTMHSSIRIVCTAALLATSCHTLAAQPLQPTLSVHGAAYASACTAAGKKAMQAALKGGAILDQQAAWRAIELMLCAPDVVRARRELAPFLPKSGVSLCEDGPDYPSGKECQRAQGEVPHALFAGGEAWGAELEVYSESIEVKFFRNDACVDSRTLGRVGGRWVVEESIQACD